MNKIPHSVGYIQTPSPQQLRQVPPWICSVGEAGATMQSLVGEASAAMQSSVGVAGTTMQSLVGEASATMQTFVGETILP